MPAIICETRSANLAIRRRFASALEWFIASADWLDVQDGDGPRYVTLTAGKADSQEFRFDPAAPDSCFDELEEMCAERFDAALATAAKAGAA